ncbi:MAG TPA: SHOCT domain-containing protein [Mycobacteriales bacterium]
MAARTAVVAGTATAVSGRVARRQARKYDDQAPEQQEPQEPQYDDAPAPAEGGGEDPDMARLQQLAQLHSQGVLSDDEFAAAKAKVLGI